MPTKKCFVLLCVLPLALGACAQEQPAAEARNTAHPLFLKDGVSDSQMIHDLNVCAFRAFKRSIEDNTPNGDTQVKCMDAMGYEVSYN